MILRLKIFRLIDIVPRSSLGTRESLEVALESPGGQSTDLHLGRATHPQANVDIQEDFSMSSPYFDSNAVQKYGHIPLRLQKPLDASFSATPNTMTKKIPWMDVI